MPSPWVDVEDYASFIAAIDAIGATERTLLISEEKAVADDKTVPSNVTLKFLQGGSLNIANTKTVTINGHVEAGLYQIFKGAGSITFGSGAVKEVYPQWWGMDGVADDVQVQAAIDSIASIGGVVFFSQGNYILTSALTISNDHIKLMGDHFALPYFRVNHAGNGIETHGSTYAGRISYCSLENIRFLSDVNAGNAIDALYVEQLRLTTVFVEGGDTYKFTNGIYLKDCNYPIFRDIRSIKNSGSGIQILGNQNHNDNNLYNVVIEDAFASNNGDNGLIIKNGRSSYLSRVVATSNTNRGIWLESTLGSRIDDISLNSCESDSNGGFGIYIREYKFVSIVNPWVSSGRTTPTAGVYITDCHNVDITSPKIFWCGAEGILLDDVVTVNILGGFAHRNVGYGLSINSGININVIGLDISETDQDSAGSAQTLGISIDASSNKVNLVSVIADNVRNTFSISGTNKVGVIGCRLNVDGIDFGDRTENYGTSAPAAGTWRQGDICWNTTPSAGGTPGWICVHSGTFGAATDNTGDTDGSTAAITGMTDTSDFTVGDYVDVSAGFPAAGPYKILAKTATSITLDTNSNAAQANITVDTSDPTFKAMANLAA